jgi:hypothetical protein
MERHIDWIGHKNDGEEDELGELKLARVFLRRRPAPSLSYAKSVARNSTQHLSFLGGFAGSGYCSSSGDIDDIDRNRLDCSVQIAICAWRCQNLLNCDKKVLKPVVHPADVLAAKAFSESLHKDPNLVVGMVAVAAGSYSAEELKELAGDVIP